MIENETKTARIEARLPEPVLALLRQAAALQGRTLSDFVVSSAREAAEQAIAGQEVIRLSLADQERFATQLLAPPKPAASLQRAAKRHADWIKRS
jgi:uncharacterized protein (DUF1778 family)